jgi:hypothetical protein
MAGAARSLAGFADRLLAAAVCTDVLRGLGFATAGASTVTGGSTALLLWAKTPLDDASSAA